MREVERERNVPGTPAELDRLVSPVDLVEWEESFDVLDVTEDDGEMVVTVGGTGVRLSLRFESREDGYYYEQLEDRGPFDHMETWVSVEPEDEGALVRARSAVELGPWLPFADRVVAWKCGGELDRLLDNLDAAVRP